jgi:hypothetical protein
MHISQFFWSEYSLKTATESWVEVGISSVGLTSLEPPQLLTCQIVQTAAASV